MTCQGRNGAVVSEAALPELDGNKTVNLVGYNNIALDVIETREKAEKSQHKHVCPNTLTPELPINKVGVFSYIFLTWFSPLVWRIYKTRHGPVRQSEIWECSEEEGVRANTERVKSLWKADVEKYGISNASCYRVWIKFVWARTLAALAIFTVFAVTNFLQSAFLMKLILSYLESEEDNVWYGVGLVGAVSICQFIRACSRSTTTIYAIQTGARFRSGMNGLLYDKLLKLKALRGKNSEILNIFSVDSYRVYMNNQTIVYLLSLPIIVLIGVVYCYLLIGYWALVTMATFTVLFFLQLSLTKFLQKLRKQCLQYTDVRVKYMSEILNSMKFIKLYAWERPFKNAVEAERKQEQKYLLGSAIVDAIASSVTPIAPTIVSVVTIAVYTAFGKTLTTSTAFAVVGITNFMRLVMYFIPYTMRVLGEAKVSLERITGILLMEEYILPSSKCVHKTNAVEMQSASFAWDSELDSPNENIYLKMKGSIQKSAPTEEVILPDVTMGIKQGQLVGVCGAVGSGKSSLMAAILGRMQLLSGHLAVNGRVAYVDQQAWIFNGTVKENILFGLGYDAQRYNDVIRCCGLEPDLQLFNYGSETEIGEHGMNISGGQKQRVSLARAAYSNSDIYILDDPMSALDTSVGKHVFHSCIRGFLNNKTVLLVTHQLQYMGHCDEVVVLEKGRIVERGHHDELLKLEGTYAEIYNTFERTTIKARRGHVSIPSGEVLERNKPDPPNNVLDAVNEMSKPLDSQNDKEKTAVGTVSVRTYMAYIKAAGGWAVATIVISLYLLAAGSLVFSEWWLSQWLASGFLTNQHSAMELVPTNTTRTSNISAMSTANTNITLYQAESVLSTLDNDAFHLVYVISFVGIVFLQIINGCIGAKVAIKASNKLQSQCLDSVLKAPMAFFESNPAGRILNRFTKDLDEGDVYIPYYLNVTIQTICLTLLAFVMSSFITPWISIAVGPVVVFFVFIKQVFTVSVRQIKRLENVARSPLISHVTLTSQGLSSITAYGQQEAFYEKCVKYGDVASMMILLFDVSTRWIALRIDLFAGLLNVAACIIFVLNKGIIPASSAGLVLSLLAKTVNLLEHLITMINEVDARFTSVERIHEYSKSLIPEPQHGSKPSKWPTEGAVEFQNVAMRYRPDLNPVLRSVSFVIKPREKVGVVGRTGAGKSSLAVSLFRLVDVLEGTILVDGQNVSKLSLNCLRSRISSIPQDPVLFNGTLRYNIDPFSNHTDDDVWEALERVNMKQKILQSDETLHLTVEENGSNFSVGERQLICLARAVLRDNKILFLDEATANIDTSTDAKIQETIRTCFADCTVITIAHRLNTVLHSDKIIVMDAGKVLESASPQDLLSDPDSYLNKMLAAKTLKN